MVIVLNVFISPIRLHCLARGFLLAALAGPVLPSVAADEPPTIIVVTNHLMLKKGAVLKMRLVVRASNIAIDGEGATLQGPGREGDPKSLEEAGVGVLLEGCVNVTVRNLKARGFAT